MVYIANPIYDAVFKYMMEDLEVAKRFIGIIIDKRITDITVLSQEVPYETEDLPILIQRLDFVAEIEESDGTKSKVLIEIQKSNRSYHADILRFRGYLARHYQKDSLPIITIYILGFKIPDLDAPVVLSERIYRDIYYNKIIQRTSDFIEKLSHNTYVIQVPRLKLVLRTKLTELLEIFNQEHQTDENKILRLEEVSNEEDIRLIIARLERAGSNNEIREKMEKEKYLQSAYEEMFGEKDREIIELKAKTEKLKQKLEKEKQKAEQEKQKAEQEKNRVRNLILKLRLEGIPDSKIESMLDLKISEYLKD